MIDVRQYEELITVVESDVNIIEAGGFNETIVDMEQLEELIAFNLEWLQEEMIEWLDSDATLEEDKDRLARLEQIRRERHMLFVCKESKELNK